MTHGQVAKRAREHKATWPELYCSEPACLWRVKHDGRPDTPCRKHPKPLPQVELFGPEQCSDCGAPFNNANPTPSGMCRACEA
jgi:hypothetical protein